MNRNIVTAAAAIALTAFLTGCNEEQKAQNAAPAQPSIAVIQLSSIYQESHIGKQGVARVSDVQAKATSAFEALQAKLEKARADKNEDEAAKLEKEMQGLAYFLQNVIKQDQEHVMNVVQTALKKALDSYREENKLIGIVPSDAMLTFDPKADVTAAVIALLDKDASDFGPLPSLEMPRIPDPASAEAAEKILKEAGSAAPADAAAPEKK